MTCFPSIYACWSALVVSANSIALSMTSFKLISGSPKAFLSRYGSVSSLGLGGPLIRSANSAYKTSRKTNSIEPSQLMSKLGSVPVVPGVHATQFIPIEYHG